ncbi:MAG TPA: YdcF family protein [Blastocatellia bacterium]|nr:YdcF family protein [Blastocatellia bacterium]
MNWKRIKRLSLILSAVFALAFVIAALLIVSDGLSDDARAADVCIIPGNKVEESGAPSPRLRARLDKAVELYKRGLCRNVITSGGVGSEGFDEAVVMKAYLTERGVAEGSILVDSQGLNTFLTAKNSSRMMKEKGWQSALVVSQYFHVSRTKLALRRFGVTPVFGAHAQYFELRDIYSITREVFGYLGYLLQSYQ